MDLLCACSLQNTHTRTHFAKLSDPLHVQLIHHVSSSSFQCPCTRRRSCTRLSCSGWTSRLLLGAVGKRRGGEKKKKDERSRKEEMMEGRPTITVCFLACWGLQRNLLHLLADTSWRVIRRVEGTRGLSGDLARHLYRGPEPGGNGAKSGDKSASFVNINSHLMTPMALC